MKKEKDRWTIYIIRERIEAVYGKHSKSFDKAFQFILGNDNIYDDQSECRIYEITFLTGDLSGAGCGCYFLPPAVMVVLATILLLRYIHWQRP